MLFLITALRNTFELQLFLRQTSSGGCIVINILGTDEAAIKTLITLVSRKFSTHKFTIKATRRKKLPRIAPFAAARGRSNCTCQLTTDARSVWRYSS